MKTIYAAPLLRSRSRQLSRRPVTTVMSAPAVTIPVTASLGEALDSLLLNGLRHLVAVGADGRCVGVLPDRAIAAAWAGDFAVLAERTVAASLDATPAVVLVTQTVMHAARFMRDNGVDAVAVVAGDGTPVGIVTGADLVAMLAG